MTPSELRATLSRLGLSQVALARAADQSPVTISRWLSGERKVPSWLPGWLAMYETLTAKQRAKIFPYPSHPTILPFHRQPFRSHLPHHPG